jgi:hypothetical protein
MKKRFYMQSEISKKTGNKTNREKTEINKKTLLLFYRTKNKSSN